jgi:hypothetical protein
MCGADARPSAQGRSRYWASRTWFRKSRCHRSQTITGTMRPYSNTCARRVRLAVKIWLAWIQFVADLSEITLSSLFGWDLLPLTCVELPGLFPLVHDASPDEIRIRGTWRPKPGGSTGRAAHGGIMNSTVVGDKLINIRSCLAVPPPPSGATRQGATSPRCGTVTTARS